MQHETSSSTNYFKSPRVWRAVQKLSMKIPKSGVYHKLALLSLLIAFLLWVESVLFYSLPTSRGMLVFGDLPAYYNYSSFDSTWIPSLQTYPAASWILSNTVGPFQGQNILYIASFALPSIGLYFLLKAISNRPFTPIIVAAGFGSVANPFVLSSVLGGGVEYGMWAFFAFLAVRQLLVAPTSKRHHLTIAVAGVLYGFCGNPPTGLVGILMGFPLIVGFFAYTEVRRSASAIGTCILAAVLFGAAALIVLPANFSSLSLGTSIATHATQRGSALSYATSNISFTFAQFGPWEGLVNGAGLYGSANAGYWTFVVIVSLLLGMVAILSRERDRAGLAALALSMYALIGLTIVALHYGFETVVFGAVPFLDLMDAPVFYQYMQTLLLPVLFYCGLDVLLRKVVFVPSTLRVAQSSPSRRTGSRASWSFGIVLSGKPVRPLMLEVMVAVFLSVVVVLATLPVIQDSGQALVAGQGEQPVAGFNYADLHSWFESTAGSSSGQILFLPYEYDVYNKVSGFVPYSRLWLIPFLGTTVYSNYHTSLSYQVLSSLSAGEVNTFAYLSGIAGVRYVVVVSGYSSVIIAPGYMGSQLALPARDLLSELNRSSTLSTVPSPPGFQIYSNRDFVPDQVAPSKFVGIEGTNQSAADNYTEVLPSPPFANLTGWSVYPSPALTVEGNGSALIRVDGSSNDSFAVVSYLVSNLSLLRTSLNPNANSVGFNSSFTTTSYQVRMQDRIRVTGQLGVSVFWYNTSNPTNFYGQFASTILLNTAVVGAYTINRTLPLPTSAKSLRLVIQLSAITVNQSAEVEVLNASLSQVSATQAVATDPRVQTSLADALVSAGSLQSGSYVLPYPYVNLSHPIIGVTHESVVLVSARTLQWRNGSVAQVSSDPSTYGIEPGGTLAGIVIFGSTNDSGNVTVSSGGVSSPVAEVGTAGARLYEIGAKSLQGFRNVTVSFTGSFILGLVALVFEFPGGNNTTAYVSLPIGALALTVSSGVMTVTRDYQISASGATDLATVLVFLPILLVCILCILSIPVLRKRFARLAG
jgi:hypothetical protein